METGKSKSNALKSNKDFNKTLQGRFQLCNVKILKKRGKEDENENKDFGHAYINNGRRNDNECIWGR